MTGSLHMEGQEMIAAVIMILAVVLILAVSFVIGAIKTIGAYEEIFRERDDAEQEEYLRQWQKKKERRGKR